MLNCKKKHWECGRAPIFLSMHLSRVNNTKLSYKVHLLQCLKGIEIKVLGLNGLKRKEDRE